MTRVTQLGYIGYNVSDASGWDTILRPVLGMELRSDSQAGCRKYRLDERHHRISLYEGNGDGLRYVGWEAESPNDLDIIEKRLQAGGTTVRRGTTAECQERAVLSLIAFNAPDGVPTEVFFGGQLGGASFNPSRGISGYNTGACGLGHVVFWHKDPDATSKWYRDNLGFRLTDYIYWEDARATFLHCNPRHHSLAIMNECFGGRAGQLNHLMVEARSMDDIGRAYDIVNDKQVPLILSLGKHTNDHNTSFYVRTPSNNGIEYGYGGMLVDDSTWEVKYYDAPMIWGHRLASSNG